MRTDETPYQKRHWLVAQLRLGRFACPGSASPSKFVRTPVSDLNIEAIAKLDRAMTDSFMIQKAANRPHVEWIRGR